MAKQQVEEVQCDRCDRKEYMPIKSKGSDVVVAAAVVVHWEGAVIEFGDLCGPCKRTVSKCVENIKKKPKGKSPERGAKKRDSSKSTTPSPKTS